jgi:hypothetical protein
MKKLKETSYLCPCLTKYKIYNRLEFDELKERNEGDGFPFKGHWDYVCPMCEKVIICSKYKLR